MGGVGAAWLCGEAGCPGSWVWGRQCRGRGEAGWGRLCRDAGMLSLEAVVALVRLRPEEQQWDDASADPPLGRVTASLLSLSSALEAFMTPVSYPYSFLVCLSVITLSLVHGSGKN